ncbi:sulfate permease [Ponticoccus sp. SC2-23]|uniref:SulP family inorganic anion transporter n=1 Tax=Alexandriicola marinus TaxID=2081710 RepID=UPI00193C38E0|nr:sulfate permease [Alexandriicola marinus]MBM1218943.1 sulfate permease [Ponticoccus sp. SC6-9]MBM1223985.1 sulfate permease [Ponticoccus sp. SC6-15]MBM1230236.1 sulfate permease [Ponticoccus sp. SC6-38]MBM1232951.1 sulfate permease [Ponticoccus sp. SC6-45]MBM1237099.1 sulfate permease [Ponticoccus sp. SC6-49]MBM1241962.1 sulfate permease [Ponticoccus sp. SC2-64]MBM1246475.1 sulfate permease [Ponticoccus sp. SC6-42]MBM1250953.1 sulfate permease [Ponticoccus sp. SC6-33]MBM1255108.1 sulfat
MIDQLRRYLPVLEWGRHYDRDDFSNDMIAAVIVTIMLIPQSLAYALLAGLPPEAGIYASIAPIILYAIFGTSRALAVGPVAVVSLLTASAIGQVAEQGTAGYAIAALTLAFMSGAFLVALGVLRLGFLANFLSHPVIAGFITASGILIAASQFRHILGVESHGHTLPEILSSLFAHLDQTNWITLVIGVLATSFLFWVRKGLKPLLRRAGLSPRMADIATKAGPVAAVVSTTLAVWIFGLADKGVAIVGEVPQSLPPLTMPGFSPELISQLMVPAILISIIGFVESISVAQTLAAKKRQRIDPDQELIGLGAANLGAAFTGGYPVTGGFARSVVNFDAGAATPAAGAFTAVGLAIAALALTPLVFFLPKATLAATIIVAVLSLVDFSIVAKTWGYAKADFVAVIATIGLTLGMGVEIGVATGVIISVLLHLYKTSKPHVAEVGLVPGTQHFRNINRHDVETDPSVLTLRVDESLYFVNARFLEDLVQSRISEGCEIKHVILMFSAVNEVDFSALESLEAINRRLKDLGIGLHLSEVKGPVMDKLISSHFLTDLNGRFFLSQYDAWQALKPRHETPRAAE